MFTGLVETTGTVLAHKHPRGANRLIIAAPQFAGRWKVGDSIAVNGVCLTALDVEDVNDPNPGRFAADIAEETAERTSLTYLQPGALVNLELPTPAGAPLGGHVVQGHVDATARVISLRPLSHDLDATDWRLTLELPVQLAPNVIPQGSITVDGISLTVAKVDGPLIEIAVIPHTYNSTNLRSLLSGALVNIETDVLSRYASHRESYQPAAAASSLSSPWVTAAPTIAGNSGLHAAALAPAHSGEWLTAEYLLANGY